ncbi:MAG TPA: hypothetical protein VNJ70_03110 [Thermoanaerobaculia bacterium]|nr:hypothetical protein [Thermoanaerobaculia bacterium]
MIPESPHLHRSEALSLLAYLPPREQVVLGHVLECQACQQLVAALLGPPPLPAEGVGAPQADRDIRAALAAGLEQAAERLAAERGVAEPALAELLALDPEDRRRRIREEARFRSLSIAHLLLERSHRTAEETPEEAESLAVLGLSILERLDPEQEPAQLISELRVRAWGLVALACWMAQRWESTREALEHAEKELVAAGYGTKGLGFRRTLAAFRRTERQSAEAFSHLTRAVLLLVGRLVVNGGDPAEEDSPNRALETEN